MHTCIDTNIQTDIYTSIHIYTRTCGDTRVPTLHRSQVLLPGLVAPASLLAAQAPWPNLGGIEPATLPGKPREKSRTVDRRKRVSGPTRARDRRKRVSGPARARGRRKRVSGPTRARDRRKRVSGPARARGRRKQVSGPARARDRRTGDRPETGPETDRRNSPAPGPENRRGPETRTGDRPETGPGTGRRKSTTITFFTKTGRWQPPDAQPEPCESILRAPFGGHVWSLFSGRVFSKP